MISEFQTSDIDELTDAQQGWDLCYRPLGRGSFKGKFLSINAGGIQIDIESYNTPIEILGATPPSELALVLPLSDSNAYNSSGKEIRTGLIDLMGASSETHYVTRPSAHILAVRIPTEKIEQQSNSPLKALLMNRPMENTVIRPDLEAFWNLRNHCLEMVNNYSSGIFPTEADKYLFDEMSCLVSRALDGGDAAHSKNSMRQYQLARSARDFMLERTSAPPHNY